MLEFLSFLGWTIIYWSGRRGYWYFILLLFLEKINIYILTDTFSVRFIMGLQCQPWTFSFTLILGLVIYFLKFFHPNHLFVCLCFFIKIVHAPPNKWWKNNLYQTHISHTKFFNKPVLNWLYTLSYVKLWHGILTEASQ